MAESNSIKLTPKQRIFIAEYMIDMNATQAAIRAGIEFIYDLKSFKEKYYVYFLIDPESNNIFYVGKGTGSRMFHHAKAKKDCNYIKLEKIDSIKSKGLKTIEVVFSTHDKESDAFEVERGLINVFSDKGLTNISMGQRSADESKRKRAEMMLNNTLPYEEWIINLPKEKEDRLNRLFGGTKLFYDKVINELTEIKNGSCDGITFA